MIRRQSLYRPVHHASHRFLLYHKLGVSVLTAYFLSAHFNMRSVLRTEVSSDVQDLVLQAEALCTLHLSPDDDDADGR